MVNNHARLIWVFCVFLVLREFVVASVNHDATTLTDGLPVEDGEDFSCPVFFFVLNTVEYETKHVNIPPDNRTMTFYGNYFSRNGTQYPPPFWLNNGFLADFGVHRYLCPQLAVAITDEAVVFENMISEWVWLECKRLGKHVKDCYRPKSLPRRVFEQKNEELRQSSQKVNTVQRAPICENRANKIHCEEAPDQAGNVCTWFGLMDGCRRYNWCGFKSKDACKSRRTTCKWSLTQGCVPLKPN
jgi:hypothetical protein